MSLARRSLRSTWAVVPFRGHGAKRRLAGVLTAVERDRLARAMLDDVLTTLIESACIDTVLVVTAEAAAIEGLSRRVRVLAEPTSDAPVSAIARLNLALAGAQIQAERAGVERLLIVPADLPMFGVDDVSAMLEAGRDLERHGAGPYVAIAPDGAELGTNALLLCPPRAIRPEFGVDSFRAHLAQAGRDGVRHQVVRRLGFAVDVDTPDDLARMLAGGAGSQTTSVLRTLGVARRLGLVAAATNPGS